MAARAGEAARFPLLGHSHMLRLAVVSSWRTMVTTPAPFRRTLGIDQSSPRCRYTALAPDRFKNFWKD
jgi:hypothetical protein